MLRYESDNLTIYDTTTNKDICICADYDILELILDLLNNSAIAY